MKKLILSLVLFITSISIAQFSAANPAPSKAYHAQIETIENALNSKNAMAKWNTGVGTNIIVINYTDFNYVNVVYPIIFGGQPILPPKTATRILHDGWTGYTEVQLSDGRQIFYINPYITPQAIISVYVSAGQYVVNVTTG